MANPYNLSFIRTDESKGVITVVPNLTSVYRIEVSDFMGNMTLFRLVMTHRPQSLIRSLQCRIILLRSVKIIVLLKNNMSVFFPAGTFYEDFDMNFDVKDEILYLHDETTPFTPVLQLP
jgi:hypothetical protein